MTKLMMAMTNASGINSDISDELGVVTPCPSIP